jgi:hypothetical protein
MDLGGHARHCSLKGCGQLGTNKILSRSLFPFSVIFLPHPEGLLFHGCQPDFLPFQCDGCQAWFCLDHRLYAQHECRNDLTKSRNVVAIVCPSCTLTFHMYESESADAMIDEHLRLSCKAGAAREKKARERKKTQCVARGCKECVHTFVCPTCQRLTCVKHRFAEDHACGQSRGVRAICRHTSGGVGVCTNVRM